MSWLFSQALVAAFSEENSWDGEPFAQLNVMPTQHKFWRNDKTMEFSSLSRFGLTCAVLTEQRGEELLTWFRAGFRVRTLALQVRALASAESEAGFGEKWQESSVRYDLATHSWRTHLCLWDEALQWSSVTLPRWGMTRNGVVFQHQTLVRPMSGTDSGCWPTPTATDYKSECMSQELVTKRQVASNKGVRLTEFLHRKTLPTPTAGNDHSGGRLDEWGGSTNPFRGTEVGRLRLNPSWTEELMNWPAGWTDLKPLAMDRFQSWLQQHSESSAGSEAA